MRLTGTIARLAWAVLAGLIAFLIVFIIGVIAAKYDTTIGGKLQDFSPLIGLLVGIVYFFVKPTPSI